MMGDLVAVTLALLAGATDPTKDAAKEDLGKLQGTWAMVGAQEKGRVLSERDAQSEGRTLLIEGDKMTMMKNGRPRGDCTVRLDPGKRPAWMDLLLARSRSGGSTMARTRQAGEVYQLKITLRDLKPPVWRRVQVKDCTL